MPSEVADSVTAALCSVFTALHAWNHGKQPHYCCHIALSLTLSQCPPDVFKFMTTLSGALSKRIIYILDLHVSDCGGLPGPLGYLDLPLPHCDCTVHRTA